MSGLGNVGPYVGCATEVAKVIKSAHAWAEASKHNREEAKWRALICTYHIGQLVLGLADAYCAAQNMPAKDRQRLKEVECAARFCEIPIALLELTLDAQAGKISLPKALEKILLPAGSLWRAKLEAECLRKNQGFHAGINILRGIEAVGHAHVLATELLSHKKPVRNPLYPTYVLA